MQKNIIYTLTDPRTGIIRYVGKSTTGLRRARQHLVPCNYNTINRHVYHWIKQLVSINLLPIIEILDFCDDKAELVELEKFYISCLRLYGCDLTNLTDGGEGVPGRHMTEAHRQALIKANTGKTPSDESKRKNSEAHKGEKHPNFGKPLSEETRQKIAAAHQGRRGAKHKKKRVLSAEHRAKMSERQKGKKHSEESKKKLSEALKGRHPTEETLEKMRAAQKNRRPISEETRRRQSESHKGKVPSKEAIEKTAAARRGRPRSEETKKRISDGHKRRRDKLLNV